MTFDDELVRTFATLFKGRRDAYGLRHGESVAEHVTLATYRAHLEGKQAIGIYPVLDDGTCYFAAVDFDRLQGNLAPDEVDRLAMHDALRFIERVSSYGLNRVYLERSKRKGAHAWVFFSEPASCADIRTVFTRALEEEQITHYELFPKQDRVTERTPLGNYINLPYPKGGNTSGRQMVLDVPALQPVPLGTFLDRVDRFSAEDLAGVMEQIPQRPQSSARTFTVSSAGRRSTLYPCAGPLLQIGLPEGEGRNELGFLIAKRLHMSPMGDATHPMFDDWNARNTPPLSEKEAEKVWEQGGKYTSMGCEQIRAWTGGQAMAIRATCVTSCPIHPGKGLANYHRLRKVLTDPPAYYVSVAGDDVRLSLDEIWNHEYVRKATFRQLNRMVPAMKKPEWEDTLTGLLNNLEEVQVPPDASEQGIIWAAVCEYLVTHATDEEERFEQGRPLSNETNIYVTGQMLRRALKQRGLDVRQPALWELMEAHGTRQKNARIHNKQRWCWSVPMEEINEQA